jgi:hypothetical protein
MGGERKQGWEMQRKRFLAKRVFSGFVANGLPERSRSTAQGFA